MEFEWHEAKRTINIDKHHIDFVYETPISFQRGGQIVMKEKLTRITWNPSKPLKRGKTNFARLKHMTESDIEKNAQSDKDNLPLTARELAQFRPVLSIESVNVKKIREKLHLSQVKFATYFGVSVRTIQDWEQHRHNPNRTARNFLTVISKEPKAVQRALGGFLLRKAG